MDAGRFNINLHRWGLTLKGLLSTPFATTRNTFFLQLQADAYQGDSEAQYMMGRCYAEGRVVDKNLIRAYAWFHLAMQQHAPQAEQAVRKLETILKQDHTLDQAEAQTKRYDRFTVAHC